MSGYPSMLPVRQRLFSRPLQDLPAAVRNAVAAAVPEGKIGRGDRIGITAGSRGIANIGGILKAVVEVVRDRGGDPFLFPSMGSHGGATEQGQAELLGRVFGISEQTMGCPVLSTMEVVELCRTPEHGIPVYIDRHQAAADGLLVVNRVKAHTDYRGLYESGLFKMITIGMGKREQAEVVHAHGVWGLEHLIPEVAHAKIKRAPILGGLAILEDGCDETAEIVGLPADRIAAEEPALLERAKEWMPLLPFEELDLLVVDRMSKEISGTGMDTNVLGRRRINNAPEWEVPAIEVVVVCDMDAHASDNAVGIGLADIATQRLCDRMDLKKTQINGLTSTFAQRLMLPVIAEHDREALDRAFYLLRRKPPEEVRMVRIRDTAHLGELLVSEALLADVRRDERLEVLGEPEPLQFDEENRLLGVGV